MCTATSMKEKMPIARKLSMRVQDLARGIRRAVERIMNRIVPATSGTTAGGGDGEATIPSTTDVTLCMLHISSTYGKHFNQ